MFFFFFLNQKFRSALIKCEVVVRVTFCPPYIMTEEKRTFLEKQRDVAPVGPFV